jgi:formyl-CoA transferase
MFDIVMRAIGREDLLADPRFSTPQARFEHREALHDILEAWTSQRDKHAAMETLAQAGAVCGAVLDTGEVLQDTHLRTRRMVQDVEHPTRGRYAMIGCPVRLSDSPVEIKPAPLHGEHTAQVLTQLAGCTPEDLARLRAAGAV